MSSESLLFSCLAIILLLVLILPFLSRLIEENLEVFLFTMGLCASLVSGVFGGGLLIKALEEPIVITIAVFSFGIVFKVFIKSIDTAINYFYRRIHPPFLFFMIVVIPGIFSSLITAIIASLVLVEIINVLKLDRKSEIRLVVLACYSIGLGAALTPIGEPLATIAISKLHQDFWYLSEILGWLIMPGIISLGLLAAFIIRPHTDKNATAHIEKRDTWRDVVVRAVKVYIFIMALVLLGDGAKPAIDRIVLDMPSGVLYWLNMVSAILDNATLTAMEISDSMSQGQVVAILMGLLISGGMLIPGNIPNIISAGRLKIRTREWAEIGVPLGLVLMVAYYVIIFILKNAP